ncbi:DMT family transporter [Paenarthrobacter nicotinovorans]|uniref:DMT family transporter n=1 Tax=Paenarthrobacter nicotinovorans TaxID=29320 RepID=UPI0027869D0C|nr:DMT family transporter [Paenarthrobacter nicotinovorans]MDP9936478.1 drug/metabolite transporter (DMT)-like permease [Paenarthrobacter nicotinovorans]
MSHNSSATLISTPVVSARTSSGVWWGLLGVVAFSFTVPLTRVAVEGMSPLFIGAGRAVVAAVLAALALGLTRQRFPRGVQWFRLAVVAGGIVAGFPLLTTFALTSTSASHGAVVIALLPAATATIAVIRGRERPRPLFWILTAVGVAAALVFALVQSGGFGSLHWADLLLLGAVLAAAIGYAEGGLLARELGAWQTISWALVVASPVMIVLTLAALASGLPEASPVQWLSFAYLGAVSMFLGFFAWYHGLAIGPMAQVSQIQLVQPVMTIAWAGLLLGEPMTWTTVVGGLAVILCAGAAVRVRLNPPSKS